MKKVDSADSNILAYRWDGHPVATVCGWELKERH